MQCGLQKRSVRQTAGAAHELVKCSQDNCVTAQFRVELLLQLLLLLPYTTECRNSNSPNSARPGQPAMCPQAPTWWKGLPCEAAAQVDQQLVAKQVAACLHAAGGIPSCRVRLRASRCGGLQLAASSGRFC